MASANSKRRLPVYVGERYLPGRSADHAMAEADRIRAAAAHLARQGSTVRLLSTTFVPEEEWMFDLFEADASSEIERIYARARVAVGRISSAIHMPDQGGRR